MFKDHPDSSQPNGSTVLWLYIPLARLLFLLEYRALWFARLDKLKDPYEGVPTKPPIDDLWKIVAELPAEEREHGRQIAEYLTRILSPRSHKLFFVSCWHANEYESDAMWRLYAGSGEGIAIKSSFERFRDSFNDPKLVVHGGLVQYVDFASYRPSSDNLLAGATLKGMSFIHEQEFRGIVMPLINEVGISVPVDLDRLISEIYVSPTAEPWYVDLVRSLCTRYGVKAKVRQSELLRHPAYLAPRDSGEDAA